MKKKKRIFQFLFIGTLLVLFAFFLSVVVPVLIKNFKALDKKQQTSFELSSADSALIDTSQLQKISDIKVIRVEGKTPFLSSVYDEKYLLFIKHIPLKSDSRNVSITRLIDVVPEEKKRSDFITYHDIQNNLYEYYIKAGDDQKSSKIFTYISADSLYSFVKNDSILSISAITQVASYSTELEGPIEFSVEQRGTTSKGFSINIVFLRKASEVIFIGVIPKDLNTVVDSTILSRILK